MRTGESPPDENRESISYIRERLDTYQATISNVERRLDVLEKYIAEERKLLKDYGDLLARLHTALNGQGTTKESKE